MKISLDFNGTRRPDIVSTSVERQAALSLDHLESSIREVTVVFSDINGPRGGVDQRCLVQVRLRGRGRPLVASGRGATPQLAFAQAVRRVRRRVERALETARRVA